MLELIGIPPHVREEAVLCFVRFGGAEAEAKGREPVSGMRAVVFESESTDSTSLQRTFSTAHDDDDDDDDDDVDRHHVLAANTYRGRFFLGHEIIRVTWPPQNGPPRPGNNSLRAYYAMSGTDIAVSPGMLLRTCYGMSGTEVPFGAYQRRDCVRAGPYHPTRVAIPLSCCRAMDLEAEKARDGHWRAMHHAM
eukprot:3350663-Rhodomonas_salina.6